MDVKFVDGQGMETKKTVVAQCKNETYPLVSEAREEGTNAQSDTVESGGSQKRRYAVTIFSVLLAMAGELVGTLILTLVICSAVASSILSGAQVGIWQVAVVCGLGVAIAIYCTAFISDAHLNPAITVAFAVARHRHFSWKKIPAYVTAQMVGGVLAGTVLYAFNSRAISLFEQQHGIERGQNSSILSAMMFGEYFPNPALYDHSDPRNLQVTSILTALAVETWTTLILAFVIFSLTASQNTATGRKSKAAAPFVIGLTVAVMISIYGPHTQVGMNPARDFGPRLVAACAGWGKVAVPGPRGGFWVYVVGPVVGALLGAALSELVSEGAKAIKKWKEREDH